jgi:hypothetical protein
LLPENGLPIALWPLARLNKNLSRVGGSKHLRTRRTPFGGTETLSQVDLVGHSVATALSYLVTCRMLGGRLAHNATATVPTITVPGASNGQIEFKHQNISRAEIPARWVIIDR